MNATLDEGRKMKIWIEQGYAEIYNPALVYHLYSIIYVSCLRALIIILLAGEHFGF